VNACIKAIEYHLPDRILSNRDLAAEFPEWPAEKIGEKTGIDERHIAADSECASDLACSASKKLLESGACSPGDVDFLILCTQSPDYFLPTTACMLQDRLGLPTTVGAFDFNLGCSGFVYGLGMAKGLIESGQARRVLLVTAETYSKFMDSSDKSVRTVFGDGAAATLIEAAAPDGGVETPFIGPLVYGSDGRGASNLMVSAGGARSRREPEPGKPGAGFLYMNGPEIFNFTIRVVPDCVRALLSRAGLVLDNVDLFVFHQANQFMLEHLRKKLGVSAEKFYVCMRHCGNTVSSTIPIALKHAAAEGRLQPGHRVMLVGFGVGYSWGAAMIRWKA
jgi:3-oxoacyl-[acyl-carrier-protein] synthase III